MLEPLDEAGLRRIVRELRAAPEIEAIAVCLLFSFIDPKHERRAARRSSPRTGRTCPSPSPTTCCRKWKEYERASTTIADAYLKPIVAAVSGTMQRRLRDAGFSGSAVVIKSNGGEEKLEAAAPRPSTWLVSGPSGGVIGARHLAELTGIERLVTLDMGGTSTDCSR